MLARREESLAAFRTALGLSPDNEETLVAAGTRAAQMRKREEALDHLERAIAINPWRADYHQAVALVHSQARRMGRGDRGREGFPPPQPLGSGGQDAPDPVPARRPEGRRKPRAEFQTLLDHDPPDRDELQSWFRESSSSRTRAVTYHRLPQNELIPIGFVRIGDLINVKVWRSISGHAVTRLYVQWEVWGNRRFVSRNQDSLGRIKFC